MLTAHAFDEKVWYFDVGLLGKFAVVLVAVHPGFSAAALQLQKGGQGSFSAMPSIPAIFLPILLDQCQRRVRYQTPYYATLTSCGYHDVVFVAGLP